MIRKPIPEGILREKRSRRTASIDRLDQIIKLGGAVGQIFSVFDTDDSKSHRRSVSLEKGDLTFDNIDLDTKADPATYSFYGRLINKECRDKGIPSPYPGGIEWTFRNSKDRVWTVNTLMYLLIQRRTAEQFILDMKETIDILDEQVSEGEAKIKELTELLAEKDEQIAVLASEREMKMKTDAYHAREELLRQKEEAFLKQTEAFKKQTEAFKRREQQIEIDCKKLSKDLASTRKAKTDLERKNQLIQNQKRSLETQYINIQKRLRSKLDQVSKKSMSDIAMQQIGEYTLLESQEGKRKRKLKTKEKVAWDIVEEWNRNMMESLERVKSENEILRIEIEDFKQQQQRAPAISELSRSPHNQAIEHPQPLNPDLEYGSYSRQSVYEFYFDRLTEIFAEHVPESVEEVPVVLQSFPQREHYIYERVCNRFGITPVPEYVGAVNSAVRVSLTESNLVKSGLDRMSYRDEEVKMDDHPKGPGHIPVRSNASLPWLDDNPIDGVSVELDTGWSFADSRSVSVQSKPFIDIGHPTAKQLGNENYYTPC